MSVRYKFKSEKNFSQILFDGIHISVADVKKEIYRQRKLGRSENIDLVISNSSNNEKYTDDEELIPKNTSLVVMRVPSSSNTTKNTKKISQNNHQQQVLFEAKKKTSVPISSNLASMDATEEEKIYAMMMQSTLDYQNYQNYQKHPQSRPPVGYICRKCHTPGHWIRDCTFVTKMPRKAAATRMTGIPVSMRKNSENRQFYSEKFQNFQVPKNFFCTICKDIFKNPVAMPCCKSIFCNECAIVKLLESDESNCPKCDEKFVLPGMLEEDFEMKKSVEKTMNFNGSNYLQYGGYKGVYCS